MWRIVGFEERLKAAFGTNSVQEIADRLELSYQAVDHYIKGRRKLSDDLLIRISNLTNCSIHWLLTGVGPKTVLAGTQPDEDFIPVYFEEGVESIIRRLSKAEGVEIFETVRDLATEALAARGLVSTRTYDKLNYINLGEREQQFIKVRLMGEIAAGKPIRTFDQFEEVLVPEEYIKKGRQTYALRVCGDSMVDEGIFDGDLLICIEAIDPFPGETVVALIDNEEATVKRFYRRGSQVRLEPANPDYEPIVLRADRVKIQGVVVGIYRRK